jgi:hypothetical protein
MAHISRYMSLIRAMLCLLALANLFLPPHPAAAAPVGVRFVEGSLHGFVVLRTLDNTLIASGDLIQMRRGAAIESRMVFHFKDGSLSDETTVFTQEKVFTLQSYRLVQRGPAFTDDTEISLERPTGQYRVKTKAHKDGKEEVHEGKLDLPADVYNGMVLIAAKNLPKGAGETVHFVAFTPAPRIIELQLAPTGEQKVAVGDIAKSATHYVFKPILGVWLKLFATLFGRTPPDNHAWIVTEGGVPAFVRFEGPLSPTGPVWRIEQTTPRWPD